MVDDSDHAGIGRNLGRKKREARLSAADKEDFLTLTRTDGVRSHNRATCRTTVGCQRLQDEKRETLQVRVFLGRDDGTGHPSKVHG